MVKNGFPEQSSGLVGEQRQLFLVGLMSGTSLDGIDSTVVMLNERTER